MPFEWFESFWNWLENRVRAQRQPALLSVGDNWPDWWEDQDATLNERRQIEQAGKDVTTQREFIQQLMQWGRRRWAHSQSGKLVLLQLAKQPPFDRWEALGPYRDLEFLWSINFIAVDPPGKGTSKDIMRLSVILVDKGEIGNLDYCLINLATLTTVKRTIGLSAAGLLRAAPSGWHPINIKLTDGAAYSAIEDSRDMTIDLLTGKGFRRFAARWALLGRRQRKSWHNGLLLAGWLAVVMILLLLLTLDPFDYADNDVIFPLTLSGLVIITTLLVVSCCYQMGRTGYRAWRLGSEWAHVLRRSCVCVLVSGRARVTPFLDLKGSSFGVPLSLDILLTLCEMDSAAAGKSWLWQQFFDGLARKARGWAFTGAIKSGGSIVFVDEVQKKHEACLDDEGISHMIAPDQKETRALPRVQVRKQTVAPGSARTASAATPSELRLEVFGRMAKLLMRIGNLNSRNARMLNPLIVLLLALVLIAGPCIYQNLSPQTDAKVVFDRMDHNSQQGVLYLRLRADDPTRYSARLNSHYWANREEPFFYVPKSAYSGRVEIKLERSDERDAQDPFDAEIEIVLNRNFLFRELPAIPVEQIGLWDLVNRARQNSFSIGAGGRK